MPPTITVTAPPGNASNGVNQGARANSGPYAHDAKALKRSKARTCRDILKIFLLLTMIPIMILGAWWTYLQVKDARVLKHDAFQPADAIIWYTPTITINVISLEVTGTTTVGDVRLVTDTSSFPPHVTPATSTTTETLATTAFTYYPLYATHTISWTVITGNETSTSYRYSPSSIAENLFLGAKRSVPVSATSAPTSIPTGGRCGNDMLPPSKRDVGDLRDFLMPSQRKEVARKITRDDAPKLPEAHALVNIKLQLDQGIKYVHSLWRHVAISRLIPFLWVIFSLFILSGLYFFSKTVKELRKIFARRKGRNQLPIIEHHSPEKQIEGAPAPEHRYTAPIHQGGHHPSDRMHREHQPGRQHDASVKPGRHHKSKQPAVQPQPQPQQSNVRTTNAPSYTNTTSPSTTSLSSMLTEPETEKAPVQRQATEPPAQASITIQRAPTEPTPAPSQKRATNRWDATQ